MERQKTVLITGVTRGIGNAVALQLAKDGYVIAGCGTMDPVSADKHIEKIREICRDFLYIQADVSKAEDRIRLVANTLEHFNRIDVLVNNAGVSSLKRTNILEATEESFNRVFDINLKGSLFLVNWWRNI